MMRVRCFRAGPACPAHQSASISAPWPHRIASFAKARRAGRCETIENTKAVLCDDQQPMTVPRSARPTGMRRRRGPALRSPLSLPARAAGYGHSRHRYRANGHGIRSRNPGLRKCGGPIWIGHCSCLQAARSPRVQPPLTANPAGGAGTGAPWQTRFIFTYQGSRSHPPKQSLRIGRAVG